MHNAPRFLSLLADLPVASLCSLILQPRSLRPLLSLPHFQFAVVRNPSSLLGHVLMSLEFDVVQPTEIHYFIGAGYPFPFSGYLIPKLLNFTAAFSPPVSWD